jgi:cytochrome c peroxidase
MKRKVMMAALVMIVAGAWMALAKAELKGGGPLPPVPIPADNPQTPSKIGLGKQLYFDPRLSADNTISCATCHAPETGWANPHPTDTGIKGQVGGRNSGSIIDCAYLTYQFWDGRAKSLEEQALGPIANPIEMGETLDNVVKKLNAVEGYRKQFKEVFGTDVTSDGIAKAIASFERTIISGPSPYDRYLQGDQKAMSEAAVRGLALFNGKAQCFQCHSGPVFSDQSFHNLGVGMTSKAPDLGREKVTNDPKDRGKFKTPGLRNVAETAPYMHNGSEKTIKDVIALYDRGGIKNPNLDPNMKPLHLTPSEQADLVVFLGALTGPVPQIEPPKLP